MSSEYQRLMEEHPFFGQNTGRCFTRNVVKYIMGMYDGDGELTFVDIQDRIKKRRELPYREIHGTVEIAMTPGLIIMDAPKFQGTQPEYTVVSQSRFDKLLNILAQEFGHL